jgi:hypothetical protein
MSNTTRYKITLVLNTDTHPRKWISDVINGNLNEEEELVEWETEEVIDTDDRRDQPCTKCGVGVYAETSIHDDWDGVLHCTNKKCNHEVKRYKYEDNPQPTQQMTLSKEQFSKLVENYVAQIVEGLDVESLESMVTELLIREYETHTEEQIVGEITEIYSAEYAAELMEDVTVEEVATKSPTAPGGLVS